MGEAIRERLPRGGGVQVDHLKDEPIASEEVRVRHSGERRQEQSWSDERALGRPGVWKSWFSCGSGSVTGNGGL